MKTWERGEGRGERYVTVLTERAVRGRTNLSPLPSPIFAGAKAISFQGLLVRGAVFTFSLPSGL